MKIPVQFVVFISTLSALAGVSPRPAQAGGREGHGGVVFLCPGKPIQLADAWEAENAGTPLSLGRPDAPMEELADEYLSRLGFYESGRAAEDRAMYLQILADLALLERDPHSKETRLVSYTDMPLNPSLDSDEISGPAADPTHFEDPKPCARLQVVTQLAPKLPDDRLLMFRRPLWNAMTNEMRVLTIFHEIDVSRAVALGFTTTTRPARELNRRIGTPPGISPRSVCQYAAFIESIGMGIRDSEGKSVLRIGEVSVPLEGTLECWASTGRLKAAGDWPRSDLPPVAIATLEIPRSLDGQTMELRAHTIRFAENSSRPDTGIIDAHDNWNIIPEFSIGGTRNVWLSGGTVVWNDRGFSIRSMTRSKTILGFIVDKGKADVDVDSISHKARLTVHE